jgi:hypothetical protein
MCLFLIFNVLTALLRSCSILPAGVGMSLAIV